MKKKKNDRLIDDPKKLVIVIGTITMLVFTIFAAVCLGTTRSPIRTSAIKSDAKDFSSEWTNDNGVTYNIVSYKSSSSLSKEKPYNLTKKLHNITDGCVVYIHSRNMVVNVYIDGRLAYRCAKNGTISGLTGFDDHIFVDVPVSANGKEIKLELYATELHNVCCIDKILIGNGVKMLKTVSGSGIIQLIDSVVYFVAAVGFLVLGLFTIKRLENSKAYIFFGIFLLFMSFCVALNSVCAYFILRNNYFIEKASKLFLTVSIPALLIYMYYSCDFKHQQLNKTIILVTSVFVPGFFLADLCGVFPYTTAWIAISVIIFAVSVIIIVESSILIYNYKKTKPQYSIVFYIILIVFASCMIFDIWYSHLGINGGDDYFMTRIGLFFLVAAVLYSALHEVFEIIKLGVQAGKIGKIAFTDANTGIGNAAAFKARIEELEADKMKYKYIGIIQFDVNNLKVINDTKGHEAGDLLIKTAADIIDQTFGKVGTCYRTGGDEFVALITGDYAPSVYEETIYRFEKRIEKFDADENRPFDLRIAYGVSYFESEKTQNMTLREVHRIADERMYDKKKQLKARYAHSAEEMVIR